MKRIIAMTIALTLLCSLLPAFAAGGLFAEEETWYVTANGNDWRVYYYAAVKNGGDEPETVNNLLFEIQNAEGVAIESTTKYKLYPEILQSGEQGWLTITQDVKDTDRDEIARFALTLTSREETGTIDVPLDASAEYLKEDEDGNRELLRAAVTNNGEGNAFQITVAMAARDADGRLLYFAEAATRDIGLAAGDRLLVRAAIHDAIIDALEAEGTEIASVDAIAYTEKALND